MELLINRRNTVSVEDQGFNSVSATWKFNGVTQGALSVSPTAVDGEWTATIPYQPAEGDVEVDWSLSLSPDGTFTRTDYYRVVTPYLSRAEIEEICPNLSERHKTQIEAAARYVINGHCGQSFGRWNGSLEVAGQGEPYLALPQRLVEITTIEGTPYVSDPILVNDGWYLTVPPTSFPPGNYYGQILEVPIRVPSWMHGSRHRFAVGARYTVTGLWGWRSVPPEINEACRLLVNDYSSLDNIYRDRYLTSMTAADWRIQFNNGAFVNTGNARVDHLLSNFVVARGMAVI